MALSVLRVARDRKESQSSAVHFISIRGALGKIIE
jgi:hypothetical protein